MTARFSLSSSTANVDVAPFRQHGRIDMYMDDDILIYDAVGPFNVETLDAMAIAQMGFLRDLPRTGRPWGSIAHFRISAMTSPEGLARYTALMKTPKPPELQAVATAFVFGPDVEGGRIMEGHYRRIYEAIGRPFACFETLPEAKAWVRAQLAAPSAPVA